MVCKALAACHSGAFQKYSKQKAIHKGNANGLNYIIMFSLDRFPQISAYLISVKRIVLNHQKSLDHVILIR